MKTKRSLSDPFRFLRKFNFRNKKIKAVEAVNVLIHPRFEFATNDSIAQKLVPNSLLFLMYSQENEELFI
ncbi:hypothetical protein [Flavobacterium turcicum]|uniref:Uncharacterized protein n=1 Tax=Flavobacterium turcicum TaxID=2764718 RepID=A0ABR7JGU6_9FLAO|nr:hypothetical protein [Flavobacterium turcicum]MBC5863714.1 hypothetical protein [Flavobacterium turcicum]NHL02338.1 hypothetical protein [Flavobacterium turcicum]